MLLALRSFPKNYLAFSRFLETRPVPSGTFGIFRSVHSLQYCLIFKLLCCFRKSPACPIKLIYYSTLSRSCQEVFIRFLNFFRPPFWHLVCFLQASRCFPVASSAPAVFRQPIYHTTSSRVCQELFSWFFRSDVFDFQPPFLTAFISYYIPRKLSRTFRKEIAIFSKFPIFPPFSAF